MKVKNTYILSGVYMTAYQKLMPHKSFDLAPSILYECEGDKWFVTTSPNHSRPGLEEISKEKADELLRRI